MVTSSDALKADNTLLGQLMFSDMAVGMRDWLYAASDRLAWRQLIESVHT